jgi:hypothetical protein
LILFHTLLLVSQVSEEGGRERKSENEIGKGEKREKTGPRARPRSQKKAAASNNNKKPPNQLLLLFPVCGKGLKLPGTTAPPPIGAGWMMPEAQGASAGGE